jgi:hypothetical protein
MMSTSEDPECVANALSWHRDDGTSLIGQFPKNSARWPCHLRYRVDLPLADGALFLPKAMEDKWAIFYQQGRIICARSWTREVHVIADVEHHEGYIAVTAIHGMVLGPLETPEQQVGAFDCLIRTHVLHEEWPLPVWPRAAEIPQGAAALAMSRLGRRVSFVTVEPVTWREPQRPIRSL